VGPTRGDGQFALPSYVVLNLRAGKTIGLGATKVNVAIETFNVTNHDTPQQFLNSGNQVGNVNYQTRHVDSTAALGATLDPRDVFRGRMVTDAAFESSRSSSPARALARTNARTQSLIESRKEHPGQRGQCESPPLRSDVVREIPLTHARCWPAS